tara:strand:+ start:3493 stop:3627 length:135 start_codon:yes stop_codon:yes gene_type:complete
MSAAQSAYERDLERTPNYHDGTPRKAWEDLCDVAKWSWEKGEVA